ncbi:glycosyltransferase family 4 protein [Candidatus Woesearchaeota archaeon]|nr:glycosyltransferase family 4 protein [Candidatus Woesearchaeota archaeon]
MAHIQVLRAGIPDLKFFGNTFVGIELAERIPKGLLVAGYNHKTEDVSSHDRWIELMLRSRGVKLEYSPYAYQAAIGESVPGRKLTDIVQETIRLSSGPVVINYHFAERDGKQDQVSYLPNKFGRDIRQVIHLHCSSEIYGRKFVDGRVVESRDNKLSRQLMRALERGDVDKFIAVSYQVKASYSGIIPEEAIEVVQNGISEETYAYREEADKEALKRQFGIRGKFLVGYCGRLDHKKGAVDLIEVIKWFNGHPEYDVGFLIASTKGDVLDTFEPQLNEQAQRMIQERRVGLIVDAAKYFTNVKKINEGTEAIFRNHIEANLRPQCSLYRGVSPVPLQTMVDTYLLPSHFEAFGLSALEAIFTGTPVVAYRVGGLPELIQDPVSGTLVEFRTNEEERREELARAVVKSIEQNYGLHGNIDKTGKRKMVREEMVSQFSSRVMADKTQAIYEKL